MRTADGVREAIEAAALAGQHRLTWAKVLGGWALNLDGSDAAATFSLPRLEVRGSAQGWRSVCLHANGTVSERPGDVTDSILAAKAAALAQARRMLTAAPAAEGMALDPARDGSETPEGACAPSTS